MVSSCDGSIIIMTLNFMYFYLFAFPCTQKKNMYATIDFFFSNVRSDTLRIQCIDPHAFKMWKNRQGKE